MIDKSKVICTIPFNYTEVFDNRQYLCCPSWLPVDVWDGNSIESSFNGKKSQEIRESILDGSYKFCDENQCPYLSGLKQNKIPDDRFVTKNKENLKWYDSISKINTVNFCFDRSCNLQCPSCRSELINYKGSQRLGVEKKLKEVNDELSTNIKRLYLSGTADPFFSKSFREFLINFNPDKYPNLKSIHLHTNGILWTESLWGRMKPIHPYVNSCEISIDAATKTTYETKTRIGGNWDTLAENLKFITKIPTIKFISFSFVVQDTNFREMDDFYIMINEYMVDSNIKYDVFFNSITNWGTYTNDEFLIKDVSNPDHRNHTEFLKILNSVNGKQNITHNFNHLLDSKIKLI